MTKILLVCMANICRSPMACSVARQLARNAGLAASLTFDSAGTHAVPGGKRMDARARAALLNRSYEPDKTRSRQVSEQDFQRFDLILAMDESNLKELQRQCLPIHHHKLRLLLSFAPESGVIEVPDPYYGDTAGFERVLDLCETAIQGLLAKL
jgi:protein-tyrosine phosphatase